jgi:hypothetical protein
VWVHKNGDAKSKYNKKKYYLPNKPIAPERAIVINKI